LGEAGLAVHQKEGVELVGKHLMTGALRQPAQGGLAGAGRPDEEPRLPAGTDAGAVEQGAAGGEAAIGDDHPQGVFEDAEEFGVAVAGRGPESGPAFAGELQAGHRAAAGPAHGVRAVVEVEGGLPADQVEVAEVPLGGPEERQPRVVRASRERQQEVAVVLGGCRCLRGREAGEEEWKAGDLEAQDRRAEGIAAEPCRKEIGMMQKGLAEAHERSLAKA